MRQMSVRVAVILLLGAWLGTALDTALAGECGVCGLGPPEGYYVTTADPLWVQGRPFLASKSMVTVSEAHLVPLDVLRYLAEASAKDDGAITLADAVSDQYLVVRLYLYPTQDVLQLSELRIFLETPRAKKILPAYSTELPRAGFSYVTIYLLVEKRQVLEPQPAWVRVHLQRQENQGYFELKG